jgi:hypothetical protein
MQNPCTGCKKQFAWHAGRGCGPCDVCIEKEEYEKWIGTLRESTNSAGDK